MRGLLGDTRPHGVQKTLSATRLRQQITVVLTDARSELTNSEFASFETWVNQQIKSQAPSSNQVRYTYREFGVLPRRPSSGLREEFDWACKRCLTAADDINIFLVMGTSLEAAFWRADFRTVEALLQQIEKTCGQIPWLIEASIAATQESSGLEAQKKIVEKVSSVARKHLAEFQAFHTSVRNEPTVTLTWFTQDIERRLNISSLPPSAKLYWRYRFLGQWPGSERGIANLLRQLPLSGFRWSNAGDQWTFVRTELPGELWVLSKSGE